MAHGIAMCGISKLKNDCQHVGPAADLSALPWRRLPVSEKSPRAPLAIRPSQDAIQRSQIHFVGAAD